MMQTDEKKEATKRLREQTSSDPQAPAVKMLRLYAPRTSNPLMNELAEIEQLGNALFNPANWGRDITSRETASMMTPVTQQPDGSYKMEVYVDVHKFKPNEVKIMTKDGRMTVEATAERKNEDGTFHSHHHLKRVLPIPEGVKKEDITAKFTEEGGVLLEAKAEAPKPKKEALAGARPLSIEHH